MRLFIALLAVAGWATFTPLLLAEPSPAKATPPAAPPEPDRWAQYSTADALWAHLEELQKGPPADARTPEERARIFQEFVTDLRGTAERFASRYPRDPRRWEAKLTAIRIAQRIRQKFPADEVEKVFRETLAAADAPPEVKIRARLGLIQIHREALTDRSPAEQVQAVEAEILAFTGDFPSHDYVPRLQTSRADLWEKRDPARAEALLDELTRHPNAYVASEAAGQIRFKNITKQPLKLKFTTEDGQEVDVEKLRGKVVLVYFWASWSKTCVAELPKIVAAYAKLRERGFEVVGVCLDSERDKMSSFRQATGMTWPDYFDGKGWKNEVGRTYGIRALPVRWLVNRDGSVTVLDGRADLAAEVTTMLCNQPDPEAVP